MFTRRQPQRPTILAGSLNRATLRVRWVAGDGPPVLNPPRILGRWLVDDNETVRFLQVITWLTNEQMRSLRAEQTSPAKSPGQNHPET